MKYFNDLKIKRKFLIIGVSFLFAIFISIFGMQEIAQTTHLQKLERDHIELSTLLEYHGKEYVRLLKKGDKENIEKAQNIMTKRSNKFYLMGLEQLLEETLKQPKAVFSDTNVLEKIIFRVSGFGKAFDLAAKDIIDCANVKAAIDGFLNKSYGLEEFEKKYFYSVNEISENGRQFSDVVTSAASFTKKMMISLGLLTSLIAIMFTVIFAKMLITPLAKTSSIANKISNGDFTEKLNIEQKDEVGSLVNSLNLICDKLGASLLKVGNAAKSLATQTQDQASSIQQTSSSLEEVSGMVQNNLSKAEKSTELSSKVSELANTCNVSMGKLTDTMESILESNNKIQTLLKTITEIGDKIKLIDEIVFQTKLLSFNASVEAERAGEHGRGFAVVAQEVGSLAKMSGQSSLEISTIVKNCIKDAGDISLGNKNNVEIGHGFVKEVDNLLKEVTSNAQIVENNTKDVLEASKEQARGIQQINTAITQLDKSSQENALLSESLELIVKQFKVNKNEEYEG